MVFNFACIVAVDPGTSKHTILVILGPYMYLQSHQRNFHLYHAWIQKFQQNKTYDILVSTKDMKILIPETCSTILWANDHTKLLTLQIIQTKW